MLPTSCYQEVVVRVLNLSTGQDTGGQQSRTAAAFRRYAPDWTYDSVARTPTYYPIERPYRPREVRLELWPEADVVHVHNGLSAVRRFRNGRHKPAVVHYHGTAYRTGPARRLAEQRAYGALGIVSTIDLWAIDPEATEWLPAPYDLDDLARYRVTLSDREPLRIAHAPTNRAVKGTDALIAAVDRLRREGAAVELDVIENRPNAECLSRKGRADVYVDQLLLGYGCNAVEAWGMGLPVIAGVDPYLAERRIHQHVPGDTLALMCDTWGRLPFYDSTEDGLYDALVAMLDPDVRAMWGAVGRQHAERWHAADRVVDRLRDVYTRAYDGV